MDHGGAGIATRRIHEALLQMGVESHILCRFKRSSASDVTAAQPDMNLYRPPKNRLLRKWQQIQRRRGNCLTEVERYERQMAVLDRQYGAAYTMPVSNYNLARHPLVQEADVIHLHWVENFVDYPSFFTRVRKPIVWTFHDENIAFGGFHYSDEAERLKAPFSGLEEPFAKIKRDSLNTGQHNIHMVALSRTMERFYHNHALAPQFPIDIIHNGLRPDDFALLDRNFCREVLGLPQDKKASPTKRRPALRRRRCAAEGRLPRFRHRPHRQPPAALAGLLGKRHFRLPLHRGVFRPDTRRGHGLRLSCGGIPLRCHRRTHHRAERCALPGLHRGLADRGPRHRSRPPVRPRGHPSRRP